MLQQKNVKISQMTWNEMHFEISLKNFHFVNEFKTWLISAQTNAVSPKGVFQTKCSLFGSIWVMVDVYLRKPKFESWKIRNHDDLIIVILLQNVDFVATSTRFSGKYLRKIHENASNAIVFMAFKTFPEKQPIVQLKAGFCFETNDWDCGTGNKLGERRKGATV